jgi:hypothetical protein
VHIYYASQYNKLREETVGGTFGKENKSLKTFSSYLYKCLFASHEPLNLPEVKLLLLLLLLLLALLPAAPRRVSLHH